MGTQPAIVFIYVLSALVMLYSTVDCMKCLVNACSCGVHGPLSELIVVHLTKFSWPDFVQFPD